MVCARWDGLSISVTSYHLVFSHTTVYRVYTVPCESIKHPVSRSSTKTPCWWGRSTRLVSHWQEIYGNSINHSLQPWWADKQVRKHNMATLEAEGLQQQNTTLDSSPVREEQDTEATLDTDSLKLGSLRLEKRPGDVSLIFCEPDSRSGIFCWSVVFCCTWPSDSMFGMLHILTWFSVHHGCKKWLFQLS